MGTRSVFLLLAVLWVLVLRRALLSSSRRLQRWLGFSDLALTDVTMTVPLMAYLAIFTVILLWLWS